MSMDAHTLVTARDVIDAAEVGPVMRSVTTAARRYLAELDALPAKEPGAVAAARFDEPLPNAGMGAEAAVSYLAEYVRRGAVHVDGPRFFHLVAGGSTPRGAWRRSALQRS